MYKLIKNLYVVVLLVVLQQVVACKEKNPEPPEEEKGKVTAVQLDFLAEGKGKQDVSIQFKDNEGVHSKQSSTPLRLQANTTYTGKISLLDESQTAGNEVTAEYNITFQVTNASLTLTRTGQQLRAQTAAATPSTDGLLRIEMKKDTDVQNVSFPVLISQ
jgi:hypothetical protein